MVLPKKQNTFFVPFGIISSCVLKSATIPCILIPGYLLESIFDDFSTAAILTSTGT